MTDEHSVLADSEGRSRWLPLDGCVNFRDLGGYRTRDGRSVRWRRLFRSDALQDMTGRDAGFAVDGLNLGLVVDLRNTDEATRDGTGPLPSMGVEYRHFPLLEERGFPPFTGGDVVERLSDAYQWLLHNSGPRVASAVTAIGSTDGGSTVFHCSAGKDRTGLLAALILEVLGVDSDTISEDYVLTNQVVEGILRRIQAMQPQASPTTRSLAAQPAAFLLFRDSLREEYGGAESYLRKHGVSGDTLDRLRSNLLE